MRWSDIQFDPPHKTLRQFAGLWLACFGALGFWHALIRGQTAVGLVLVCLALVVGLVGLTRPGYVRFIYVGWMILAFPIGWTVSQFVLAVVFFGLFAPIGLIFRLLGRDLLHREPHPELESYWVAKPAPADPRRYFQQF
jgi:hypothetical protein